MARQHGRAVLRQQRGHSPLAIRMPPLPLDDDSDSGHALPPPFHAAAPCKPRPSITEGGTQGAATAEGPQRARAPQEHFIRVPPWRRMGLTIDIEKKTPAAGPAARCAPARSANRNQTVSQARSSEDVFQRRAGATAMPQAFPERKTFPFRSARTGGLQSRPKASRRTEVFYSTALPDDESPRSETAAAECSSSSGFWDEPVLVQAARNIIFLLLLLIDLCCRLGSAFALLPVSLIRAVSSPSPPWHCTTPRREHSSHRVLQADSPGCLGLLVEAFCGTGSFTS